MFYFLTELLLPVLIINSLLLLVISPLINIFLLIKKFKKHTLLILFIQILLFVVLFYVGINEGALVDEGLINLNYSLGVFSTKTSFISSLIVFLSYYNLLLFHYKKNKMTFKIVLVTGLIFFILFNLTLIYVFKTNFAMLI